MVWLYLRRRIRVWQIYCDHFSNSLATEVFHFAFFLLVTRKLITTDILRYEVNEKLYPLCDNLQNITFSIRYRIWTFKSKFPFISSCTNEPNGKEQVPCWCWSSASYESNSWKLRTAEEVEKVLKGSWIILI